MVQNALGWPLLGCLWIQSLWRSFPLGPRRSGQQRVGVSDPDGVWGLDGCCGHSRPAWAGLGWAGQCWPWASRGALRGVRVKAPLEKYPWRNRTTKPALLLEVVPEYIKYKNNPNTDNGQWVSKGFTWPACCACALRTASGRPCYTASLRHWTPVWAWPRWSASLGVGAAGRWRAGSQKCLLCCRQQQLSSAAPRGFAALVCGGAVRLLGLCCPGTAVARLCTGWICLESRCLAVFTYAEVSARPSGRRPAAAVPPAGEPPPLQPPPGAVRGVAGKAAGGPCPSAARSRRARQGFGLSHRWKSVVVLCENGRKGRRWTVRE